MVSEDKTFTNPIYNFVFCFNQDMSNWWSLYITWSFNHLHHNFCSPDSCQLSHSWVECYKERFIITRLHQQLNTIPCDCVFFFQIVGTNNKRLFLMSKFNIDMWTEPDNSNNTGIKTCRACEWRVPSLELLGAFSTGYVTPSVCSFQWCDLGFA